MGIVNDKKSSKESNQWTFLILSRLGYDDGYDLSIKYPILMDYIDMSYRISSNIPNVKIARYYWLKFNMSNGMDTWMDKNPP